MNRWMIALIGPLVVVLLFAGAARAAVEPVALGPMLDQPARLVFHDAYYPPGGDSTGVVVVNLDGQDLRAEGDIIAPGRGAKRGTLREVLGSLLEPWKYSLFAFRGADGRTLGYLLVHTDAVDSFFYDEKAGVVSPTGEIWGGGDGGS